MIRFNPFRPNNLVGPGAFSGRTDEIGIIEKCLFQTVNESPQSFIIEGERGIGKSSLFLLIQLIASGKIDFDEQGNKMNFLVVSLDLGTCEDYISIVRQIAVALKAAVNDNDRVKSAATEAWEFLRKWEVLGVKYHKEDVPIDEETVTSELIRLICEILNGADRGIDGLLILIDEADHPPVEAGLGVFVKLLNERLTRRQCSRCLVGMAGLPSLLPKLRESHASSPRVFEALSLEPLEDHERKQVVLRGLDIANQKNSEPTTIDDDALEFIADLSEGYPHFIQQFAYSAFDVDTDNLITRKDVARGAYQENGALQQLGHKYFNRMYFKNINSDNYRLVLDVMSKHGTDWVAPKQIIEESGLSKFVVNNALRALRDREIIVLDETRRGFYRLPTRSFATWINAFSAVVGDDGELPLE